MENKLTSMTDFVLVQENAYWNGKEFEYGDTCINNIINYANFLKQPLELGMLVPCNENNVPLEEPVFNGDHNLLEYKHQEFMEAKEKVLFEGLIIDKGFEHPMLCNEEHYLGYIDGFIGDSQRIESLICYNLTLTPTAIKQIYGK